MRGLIKVLRSSLVALTLLPIGMCLARAAAPVPTSVVAVQSDNQNRTVYITRTGKRYHGPNCRYLRQSKIPIKLKDALAEGYTACHVCGGR